MSVSFAKRYNTVNAKHQTILDKYSAALPQPPRRDLVDTLRRFLESVGDAPLESPQDIRQAWQKWEAKLRRRKFADGSIHMHFSIIRRGLRVSDITWPFTRGEAPVVRESEVFAPALDEDSVKAAIDVVRGIVPTHTIEPQAIHRCFWSLSTVYGLRRKEMVDLTPDSLNIKKKMIFIETLKSGRQRYQMVPDCIMPYLVEWGFIHTVSNSGLSIMFHEICQMAGADIKWIGWHAIRRALVLYAERAGIPNAAADNFLRWKKSTSDMRRRYAAAPLVGFSGETDEMSADDSKQDALFFASHPFLKYWE